MTPFQLASTTFVLTLLCCVTLFVVTTAVPTNHSNGGAALEDEYPLSRAAGCNTVSTIRYCWGQTEVPQGGFWPEITNLDIYNSNIQVLRNNAFQSYPNLKIVRVGNSNIESIETNAFSGLSSVRTLRLDNNKIQNVRSVKFPENVTLDVSKNPLDFSGASPFPESCSSLSGLYADDVGLSAITSLHIKEFKALRYLSINYNYLTALNLEEFVGLEILYSIRVQHNTLENIVGLPSGVELLSVTDLDASYNNIRSLDPHVFKGLPALDALYLEHNPLTIQSSAPFLSHEYLNGILLSGINAAALSAETFQCLPSLEALIMNAAGVSDITGVFSKLPVLGHLDLMGNNVESVKEGTFAAAGILQTLILSHNPLREFDPAALDDVMKEGGTIDISHSPMACAKDYDDLSEWCSKNNVRLNAACKDTTAPPGTNPPGTNPPGTAPPVDDDCAADVDCGEGFCCKNKECLEKGKCGVGTITALPFFVLLILAYFTLAQELTL